MKISRRSLLSGAAAAAAAAVGLDAQPRVRGAAIQLHPKLGDDSATFWHTSGAAGRTAYLERRSSL